VSQHKQLPGVDIDAIHRTWPHQRGLFRKRRPLLSRVLSDYFSPLRGQHPATWVMLALAIGFVVGLCVGAFK